MDLEELARLIRQRRSIRLWQQRPVPDELIRQALSIATWAPNGGNKQSWKFVVVKNRQLIERIADAVCAKADLLASWAEGSQYGDETQQWRSRVAFFRQAPVCIAVLIGKYESVADKVLELRGMDDPDAAAIATARKVGASRLQSIGAVIAYMMLVLEHYGLGTCWMAGPQQAKREIEQLLGAPDDMDFVALIPVGYPAETRESTRRPIDEVVTFYE